MIHVVTKPTPALDVDPIFQKPRNDKVIAPKNNTRIWGRYPEGKPGKPRLLDTSLIGFVLEVLINIKEPFLSNAPPKPSDLETCKFFDAILNLT